jgi:hypothetical protein
MAVQINTSSNAVELTSPEFSGQGDVSRIRLFLNGSAPPFIGTERLFVISPDGSVKELISLMRSVDLTTTPFSSWSFALYEMEFTFSAKGLYTFVFSMSSALPELWITSTFVADWATRIDIPISDLKKQRTDMERIYSKLNRG